MADNDDFRTYEVYEMINIELSSTLYDDLEPVKVDWSPVSFDGSSAQLQMHIEQVERYRDYDSLDVTFYDASGLIQSPSDKRMDFGKSAKWKLAPFLDSANKARVDTISTLWVALVLISLTLSFVLALMHGSLVSTWMLINTLQLIAHVPLISSHLPANAHFFFLNLLQVVRWNIAAVNSSLNDLSSHLAELQMVDDESSSFSDRLFLFGYSVNFGQNLLFGFCILSIMLMVWLLLKVHSWVSKAKKVTSRASTMTNFLVRFLYEAFFELMICAFINLPGLKQVPGSSVWWAISLGIAIAGIATTVLLFSMCVRGRGPNVRDTYEQGTLLKSFWGVRELDRSLKQEILSINFKLEVTKNKAAPEIAKVAAADDQNLSIFNSDVPLNQQLCTPVDIQADKEMYEGGHIQTEHDGQFTTRGLATERGLVSEPSEQPVEVAQTPEDGATVELTEAEALYVEATKEAKLRM